ncbi:MAG TPA: TIR domain-containing protein [Ktedonobacteraceae bacterium]
MTYAPSQQDFFISYTGADRAWAEWIGWELEAAGYTVVLQAWDFSVGTDFVGQMERASQQTKRTLVVLSPRYLAARFTQAEWHAAFRRDPTGELGLLVPVRIEECGPGFGGLLANLTWIDLVGLEEDVARKQLLAGLRQERGKPLQPPSYPGGAPHSLPPPSQFPSQGSTYDLLPQQEPVQQRPLDGTAFRLPRWLFRPASVVLIAFLLLGVLVSGSLGVWGLTGSGPLAALGRHPATATPPIANTHTSTPASWKIVSSPDPGSYSPSDAIAVVSATDIWLVGDFRNSHNTFQTPFAHYNGSSWSLVPGPLTWRPRALSAISATDMWAVGSNYPTGASLTEHWDGSSWSVVPSPSPEASNVLLAVSAISSNNVWAAGYQVDSSRNQQALIEHWNGSSWSIVPTPTIANGSLFYGMKAISSTDVWAVGYALESGQMLIEHWNGSSWNVVSSPVVGAIGYLQGMTALSATNVWAVGWASSGPNQSEHTLIEHWNGSDWSVVSSPNNGAICTLAAITALSATDIWAVGSSSPVVGSTTIMTLIEHWDGANWSIMTSPNATGTVSELFSAGAASSSDIWAVGQFFTSTSNNPQALIEHYTWQ